MHVVDAQGTRGDAADVTENAGAVAAAQRTSREIEEGPIVTRARVRFRLFTLVGIAKAAADGERPAQLGDESLHQSEIPIGRWTQGDDLHEATTLPGRLRKIVSKLSGLQNSRRVK